MPDGTGDLLFNDDLLLNEGDLDAARERFPLIDDVLEWPSLKAAFRPIDDEARRRKRRAETLGLLGLSSGFVGLCLATLDPYLQTSFPPWVSGRILVAGLGLVFVIAGIGLSTNVLRGADREAWLLKRLTCERLRQLHFQWIVRRAAQIARSTREERVALAKERDRLLKALLHDLQSNGPGRLRNTLDHVDSKHELESDVWMVGRLDDDGPGPADEKTMLEIEGAYMTLRLRHQALYAARKLADGAGLWPWSPQGKVQRLSIAGNALTMGTVVVSVLALSITLSGQSELHELAGLLGAATVLLAIGVLALRVIDEGLRPRSEVTRYRAYRAETEQLTRLFEQRADHAQRLALMESMEALSYREMCQFLTEHSEASFSM